LIALQGQAIDIFLSSSLITTNVAVNRNPDINLTQILNTNVASGFSTGDINLVFQTINNVSLIHNCIYMYIYIDKYIYIYIYGYTFSLYTLIIYEYEYVHKYIYVYMYIYTCIGGQNCEFCELHRGT
jgi:hypothetical protein